MNSATVEILKKMEGFSEKPYKDGFSDGVQLYSIGFGIQIGTNPNYPSITKEQATEMLLLDVKKREDYIKRYFQKAGMPLTENQLDAITLFSYNLGLGVIPKATFIKYIIGRQTVSSIKEWWHKYKLADGKPSTNLYERRKFESALFFGENAPIPTYIGGGVFPTNKHYAGYNSAETGVEDPTGKVFIITSLIIIIAVILLIIYKDTIIKKWLPNLSNN